MVAHWEGEAALLGDLPALNAQLLRMPDRRQVSLRWLTGSVLAGLTSTVLMGGALFAALEGKQELAQPGKSYERSAAQRRTGDPARRGDRPGINLNVSSASSKVLMVSTVIREGDRDVVKVRPFLHVDAALAVGPRSDLSYPPYDPVAIFSESGKADSSPRVATSIYGANVDSEVSLKTVAFDPADARVSRQQRQRASDVEELVRAAAPRLDAGAVAVAPVSYFDPGRFSLNDGGLLAQTGVTITAENITSRSKTAEDAHAGLRYEERVVRVRAEASIAFVLKTEGMDAAEAKAIEKVLASDLGSDALKPDDRVRIAFEIDPRKTGAAAKRASRIGVYRNATHLVSIARTDDNKFVYAVEPSAIPQIAAAGRRDFVPATGRLPSLYDAIYRASLSEGLGSEMARKLVRILSSDVDLASTVQPSDSMDVFLSLEDGQTAPTKNSDVLYVAVSLGDSKRRYFRFRDSASGEFDYYDEEGKSARKSLLRQPVPAGTFRSSFGMRYHPILRYNKMHWGVDWTAPRGTPILSAGDGTVEFAGWESGYGKQTRIRHLNGYITSYSHQSAIAGGIVPGAKVRQGQLIGYVGSTGLSTGPHLHYEVVVNGAKVDPMRIRLPKGKALKESLIAAFKAERDRIEALLASKAGDQLAQF
jgi:murein DD-endopeptidase MepM/ murein hydrolase activator NlpD